MKIRTENSQFEIHNSQFIILNSNHLNAKQRNHEFEKENLHWVIVKSLKFRIFRENQRKWWKILINWENELNWRYFFYLCDYSSEISTLNWWRKTRRIFFLWNSLFFLSILWKFQSFTMWYIYSAAIVKLDLLLPVMGYAFYRLKSVSRFYYHVFCESEKN